MEVLMKKREKIMEYVFLLAAVISIVAVALICIFLFANGIPAMKKIGFAEFLTGTKWKPGNNKFGIFPMILGSIYVTGGALIIGVAGRCTHIYFYGKDFCPEGLYKRLKAGREPAGGHSVYRIRIFRTGCARTVHPGAF